MKIWLLVAVLVVVGVGLGIGVAVVQVRSNPWDSQLLESGPQAGDSLTSFDPASIDAKPSADVDNPVHDFGMMDASADGSHDFVITNNGKGDLELGPGGTTCSCTLSEISQDRVPPGESAEVTVEWHGKNNAGRFHHTAKIITNDPAKPQIELVVQGRLMGAVGAFPQELTFSRVTTGDSAVGTVKMFGYLDQPLEITGYEATAPEHLDVSVLPLSPELIEAELGAKSGKLVRVTVKSGLPLGRFNETITLKTNIEKVETFAITVQGNISSEVSVVGPRWSRDANALMMGIVDSAVGATETLLIRVGGPNRKEVGFKLTEIVPDFLEVELGEPSESPDGRLAVFKLIVRVPKGTRPASHLGPKRANLGRISFESTHPDSPDLDVYVRFAVGS